MARRPLYMAGILSMLPLASSAATLPLDGSYGNRDGCAYAKSGEYTGSEDFLLLTADNVRSAVAFCEFKRIEKVEGDRTSVAMSCADEGEAGNQDMRGAIVRTGIDSVRVDFEDGTEWGPMKRCE